MLRQARQIGDYSPSDERCQFCSVGKLGKCGALEQAAQAAATEDFSAYVRPGSDTVTDAELWEIAERAEKWIKNMRESVLARMFGGTPVEGFKIVAGQGKWGVTDRRGLVDHLTREGFGETDIFVGEPALVSLNQAKGLYSGKGSGVKREALQGFFEKKEGAPKVVLESDPRPATDAGEEAKKDFANYKREEKT